MGGGEHAQVGSSLLTIQGVVPQSFADDGSVLFGTNGTEFITLHGGSGQTEHGIRLRKAEQGCGPGVYWVCTCYNTHTMALS